MLTSETRIQTGETHLPTTATPRQIALPEEARALSTLPRIDYEDAFLLDIGSARYRTGEQWARFEAMYGVRLLQMYGMSEAGWLCGNRHYKHRVWTVGLPALHQELAIVDREGRPCPPDIEGEVTAGGPHCAVGYLNDDGSIEPIRGKRIKSGDLAIMDDDGFIRVTGRTKDLIIRGGVNIAPLEIDEVLLKHPGVADAAAVGVPDPIQGEEVVCYVVARPGAGLTEAAVLEHCRAAIVAENSVFMVLRWVGTTAEYRRPLYWITLRLA